MKKFLLTTLLALFTTVYTYAETISFDGINYYILSTTDLTLQVSGFVSGKERTTVKIPGHIDYLGRTFSVIEIKRCAFEKTTIEHIELPNTIKTIGGLAFHNTNLKEAILPEGLDSIDKAAFFECTSLEKVILPSSVTKVWCSAFTDCGNIETVIVEDSNKHFSKIHGANEALFGRCSIENFYLGRTIEGATYNTGDRPIVENLTIGSKVTSIEGMFNFSQLKRIKLMTSVPPAVDKASDKCHMTVNIYVPKGSLEAYQSHSEWGKYWNIEEYDESCAAPEISYEDGMLKVTPVTQGSICHYTIIDNDIVTDAEITGGVRLSGTYEIEAYAVLNGSKSERSYATLCWIDNTFNGVGITQPLAESKRPVIIKSNNGQIVIEGLEDGETIHLYTIDGKLLGRTSAYGGSATFDTMLESGQTLIIRAGENSIKFLMR